MSWFKKLGNSINKAEDAVKKKEKDLQAQIAKKAKDIAAQEAKIQKEIQATLKKIKLPNPKDMAFLPLLPFKSAMALALDKEKVIHTSSLADIATKFHDHIVENGAYNKSNTLNGNVNAPRHTFENNNKFRSVNFENVNNFEDLNYRFNADGDASDDSESTDSGSGDSSSSAGSYEKDAKQTMGLIQKIIAWFKARKEKKEAAKRLKAMQDNPQNLDPIQAQVDQQILAQDPQMTALDNEVIDAADSSAKDISNAAIQTTDDKNGTKTTTDKNGKIIDVKKTGKGKPVVAGFSVVEIVIFLGIGVGVLGFVFRKK